MRFHLATLCLALFSSLALAAGSTPTEEMKPYVVSYPSDTPMKVMDDTMDEIVKAVSPPSPGPSPPNPPTLQTRDLRVGCGIWHVGLWD